MKPKFEYAYVPRSVSSAFRKPASRSSASNPAYGSSGSTVATSRFGGSRGSPLPCVASSRSVTSAALPSSSNTWPRRESNDTSSRPTASANRTPVTVLVIEPTSKVVSAEISSSPASTSTLVLSPTIVATAKPHGRARSRSISVRDAQLVSFTTSS